MRVLYYYSVNQNLKGVNAKIVAKVNLLKRLGVDLAILTYSDRSLFLGLDNDIEIIKLPSSKAKNYPNFIQRILNFKYLNFIKSIIDNKKSFKTIELVLNEIDFDFVIFRYGISDFFKYKLTKKFKHKFIYELNTKELEQFKLRYFGITKSQSWITYSYLSEKYFGPLVFKYSAGLIAVTKEIMNYESSKIDQNKNKLPLKTCISNGIEVENYPISTIDSTVDNEINMVMIRGVDAVWHGFNRIVDGLKKYNGSKQIKLYIIGSVEKLDCKHIIYLGEMTTPEINVFFEQNNIHLGISSLGLHRTKIFEASVLKTRDYLSRGIPVVLSYEDTDFIDNNKINDFVLKLPSDESAVEIEQLIKFYEKISIIKDYNLEIRNFALSTIDMKIKMNSYKLFMEKIHTLTK